MSLPAAMPNQSDDSQLKRVCAHTKHVLSAIFTFSRVFSLSLLLLVRLPVSLSSCLLSSIISYKSQLPFLSCFSQLFGTSFSCIPDTPRIMWLTTVNIWNSAMGDEVNAIHSTLIRIHYITLDRGTVQPSICHFLRNGYNRQKMKKKNQYPHQISLATENNGYFHIVMKKWLWGGNDSEVSQQGGMEKEEKDKGK